MKKLLSLIVMILSTQAFAQTSCPLSGSEIDALVRKAAASDEYALVRALNRCGTNESTSLDRELIDTAARKWLGISETYNIDRLKIETNVRTAGCETGSKMQMSLTGMIGPDSSFAMDKLLRQLSPCRDEGGNLVGKIELNLNSGGGLLKDGYKLGNTLKQFNVRATIKNDSICASSCAVAFLGAADRVLEDSGKIMFHAPYFSGKNEYGEKDIDCDVGQAALEELERYYISMTDKETGERLFERTMWYCSATDGWVITGGAAAELFGIATDRKTPEPAYVPKISGITGIDLAMLGMKLMDTGTFDGVWVVEVIPNSPADEAGLKSGDIVTRFARRSITKIDDLNEAKIDLSWAAIPVRILRAGRPQFLGIRLPN